MKKHIIIVICLVLLTWILGYWLIVSPTSKQLPGKKNQVKSLQSDVNFIKSQHNKCKLLITKVNHITLENQQWLKTFMQPQPINQLLATISHLFITNHLEISSLQPSMNHAISNKKMSTYTIQGVGDYFQLLKFMQACIHQLSIINITDLHIKKLANSHQVAFTLTLDMPHV